MSEQNPTTVERFTLVVQEVAEYGDKLGVKGKPHGQLDPQKALYINRSSIPVVKIESFENKDSDDGMMEIIFENKGLPKELTCAVLTDVEPQTAVEPGRPIENPFLLGLVRDYKELRSNRDYTNELCFNFVHARFVVAVYSDDLGKEEGQVKKGTKVGFPMLTIKDEHKILPVFTDWTALSKWTNVFDDKHPPKCIVMNFDNATEIGTKDCEGLVVNPFDNPVPIPTEVINDIKNSSGYKAEKNVKQEKVEKNTPIQIGVPQENEQIRLTKEALVGLGGKKKEVKEIYLFAKRDANGANLLVIFDLDFAVTEDERREIFDEAYRAVVPAVGRQMKVEFAMKAPAFIKLCSGYEPIYKS